MGTSIINPEGLNAEGGAYPAEIYANFPVMLRRLSYIYAVVAGIGALAIKPPPQEVTKPGRGGKAVQAAEGSSLGEAVKDKKFWLMWFMVRLVVVYLLLCCCVTE